MRAVRTGAIIAMTTVLLASCNADDPVGAAADAICDAIDTEASDVTAFTEYELAIARERRDGMDEDELQAALDERCGRAIVAITAASVKAVEEPTDEDPEVEEAEPDPVDLGDLDWASQPWETTCTESGDVEALRLTSAPEEDYLSHNPDPDAESTASVSFAVDETSALYGDITNDGFQEAVFASECSFGNGYSFNVEVWSHDKDGQPLQLPTVIEYTKWDGVIEGFDVVEGKLRINTSEPAPGEDTPHLNGYLVQVVTDWSFGGDTWSSTEVSRTDTTPAPEPEPQPSPEPEPEPAPAPDSTACEQLGFEGAEEDWCAETLRSMEECYLEVENDPNWIDTGDGLYEHAVTGLVTTCDI